MEPEARTASPQLSAVTQWGSFLFAIFYLVAEYMRPQSMYPALSAIPMGQLAIVGLLGTVIVEGRAHLNSNRLNVLLIAYLSWFTVSYLNALRPELAIEALIDFSKWVVIYFLLINTINTRAKLYFFLVAFLLLNFKYAQYAVRIWVNAGFYSDPRGLNAGGGIGSAFFQNPNDFGIAMSSVLGLSIAMIAADRAKWLGGVKARWFHIVMASTLLLAIVSSSSRGAALGAAGTAAAVWAKSSKKALGLILAVALAAGVVAIIPDDNWARFRAMGSEHDESGQSRLSLWKAGIRMALEYPLTGVGPNNFIYVNTQHYMSEYAVAQHNVFIQAASELGIPGLLLFIAMVAAAFANHRDVRKILAEKGVSDPFLIGVSHGLDICLLTFCVNGFFITVLYYPFVWMLFIIGVSLKDIAIRTNGFPRTDYEP